jgi:hypothetical protein
VLLGPLEPRDADIDSRLVAVQHTELDTHPVDALATEVISARAMRYSTLSAALEGSGAIRILQRKTSMSRVAGAVVDMAYFLARDQAPAAVCREAVEQAEVYVVVAGFRYGSPVRDQPDSSCTELTPPRRGCLA